MARYRGRHRAPTHTGRVIARSALAGVVAGVPLVAVVPTASAASDSTWDRLAQCESGGRWNISTGNGFAGGLQFTPSTWRAYGGGRFASSAQGASRAQQIVVAERVLAGQGWGAWPVCSRKAGARGEAPTQRSAPAEADAPQQVRLSAPANGAPTRAAAKSAARTSGAYVVKRGDSLGSIASTHRIAGGWKSIVAKNPALAANPGHIMPGQKITV